MVILMGTEKKAVNTLMQVISNYIDNALNLAKFDITTKGKIVEILSDTKYRVQIQGTNYIVPCYLNINFQLNDIVLVTVPQSNWSNIFILSKGS